MSGHRQPEQQMTQNQNNQMSDDPGDGSRNSETLGRDSGRTAAEQAPDTQDRERIEAFGRAGAGKGEA